MKKLLCAVAALALVAARHPMSGGNTPGEFKGYAAVNEALKARLIDQGTASGAYFQLGHYFGDQGGGLATLLGSFSGGAFRNGAPNSLNMLLWYLGFSAFADAVATSVCEAHSPTLPGGYWRLTDAAFQALTAGCDLPLDPAARHAALLRVWLATVAYDAPHAEFEAWAAGLGAAAAAAPGKGTLTTLLTGAFLDPYFLLEP